MKFYFFFLIFVSVKSINAQSKSLWSNPVNVEISNRIAVQKFCEYEDKKTSNECITEYGWTRVSSNVQQKLTKSCSPGYVLSLNSCVEKFKPKICQEFEFSNSKGCFPMSAFDKDVYLKFLSILNTSKLSPDTTKDIYAKAEHTLNRFGYGPRTDFLNVETLAAFGIKNIAKYITLQFKLSNNQSLPVEQNISKLYPDIFPYPGKDDSNLFFVVSNFVDLKVDFLLVSNELDAAKEKKLDESLIKEINDKLTKIGKDQYNLISRSLLGTKIRKILSASFNESQFGEILEEFWLNHFNVKYNFAFDNSLHLAYINAIRSGTFSNFYNLLFSSATNPLMNNYLHNNTNICYVTKSNECIPNINEDYGREVMELHTLNWPANDNGASVYTQQDVHTASRILSGWGNAAEYRYNDLFKNIKQGNSRENSSKLINDFKNDFNSFVFNQNRHDNRPLSNPLVLSNPYKDSSEPPVSVYLDATEKSGVTLLKELSMHIATRRGICTKLMVKFVNDDAKRLSLLDIKDKSSLRGMLLACDKAWKESGGDLKKVYLSIFTHPDFWSQKAYNKKIKTPFESLVSSIRISGVSIDNVTFADTKINNGNTLLSNLVYLLEDSGMPLYECLAPTGYSDRGSDWISIKRVTNLYKTSNLTTSFYKNLTYESYAKDNVASGKTLGVYNLLKEVFDLRFIANTNSQNSINNIVVNSPNTVSENPQLIQTFLSHSLSSQEFLIK